MNITNDMVKEHLLLLTLNTKIHDQFAQISSGTKAAFTRAYNKGHQDIVRKKQEKQGAKKGADQSDSDLISEDGNGDVLIDENELADIKKAKQLEKAQKKADRAMKRIEGYNKITKNDAVTPPKGKKKASTAGGRAKRPSRPTGRKGRDEDVLASDDSLNDFIVADDVEIERVGKKRRR